MLKHVEAGNVRLIAIASPQRLAGKFAQTPTWIEQGEKAVVSNWRGLVGPKGMSGEQIAYWDGAVRGLSQTAEWKKELERNDWAGDYKASTDARRYMEAEYSELKAFLVELELAK